MSEKTELFVTVRQEAHVEFEEKRSIFLGHALRTDSEEAAQALSSRSKSSIRTLLTTYLPISCAARLSPDIPTTESRRERRECPFWT
ncbi:MAG: hypothetical protein IJX94_05570 [Clostridia bacterium]|nr:hypothetical protein [Clostridia bacterium]